MYKGLEAAKLKRQKEAAENPLNAFNDYELVCPKCGKTFIRSIKLRDYQKGKYSKFCSRACANSRVVTDEHKEKTRQSILKRLEAQRICSG